MPTTDRMMWGSEHGHRSGLACLRAFFLAHATEGEPFLDGLLMKSLQGTDLYSERRDHRFVFCFYFSFYFFLFLFIFCGRRVGVCICVIGVGM